MKTEHIVINENAFSIFSSLFDFSYSPLLVADDNTWEVCGKFLFSYLKKINSNISLPLILNQGTQSPHADMKYVRLVESYLTANKQFIAIAVGSGTINDICKLASNNVKRPYYVFATAPSVDGYSSAGAAITENSFKNTYPCSPPHGVFALPSVIRNAPMPMLSSGYGDLIAKVFAGADWLIASELDIQKVDNTAWNILQPKLPSVISQPQKFIDRDSEIVSNVFASLIDSGLAIVALGDSRPASGAEHLFSHALEMFPMLNGNHEVSHGHKVALGTLVSSAFYTLFLETELNELIQSLNKSVYKSWEERKNEIEQLIHNEKIFSQAIVQVEKKHLDPRAFERRKATIIRLLPKIKKVVQTQIISFDSLKKLLSIAKCPIEPIEIGLTKQAFYKVILISQVIRTRYTLLDLLYEMNLFESFANEIVFSDRFFK